MRHIKYIIINDSMPEASRGKSSNIRIDNLGYHYVINSQGEVLNPIDVSNPANLTLETRNLTLGSAALLCKEPETKHLKPQEVERLNACSIGVKYNGKLSDPRLRPLLLALLNELHQYYPEVTILAKSEYDRYHIRVRKDMNQLRRELSDMI